MQKLKTLFKDKKGLQIGQLAGIAIAFLVVGLTLTFGSMINQSVRDSITGNTTYAYNTTTEVGSALFTFADWLPILAIVCVASVIIFVLVAGFGGRRGGA